MNIHMTMPCRALHRAFVLTTPCCRNIEQTRLLTRFTRPVLQIGNKSFSTRLYRETSPSSSHHTEIPIFQCQYSKQALNFPSFRYLQRRAESTTQSPKETISEKDALAAAETAAEDFIKTNHVQQPSISRALIYFAAFTLFAFSTAAYRSLTETSLVADKLRDQSLFKQLAARFLQGGSPEQWLSEISARYAQDQDFWGPGISEEKLIRVNQLLRTQEAAATVWWLNDRDLPASIKAPILQAYKSLLNKVLNISISQQMILPVIFVNTLIFLAWTRGAWSGKLLTFLNTNFTHRPSSGLTHTLLTSSFSHQAPWHFIFNNFALWTFGGATVYKAIHDANRKDNIPEASPVAHFLAFFAVAGVFAAMTSHIASALRFKQAVRQIGLLEAKKTIGRTASLGSSGAIWSVIAMTACTDPDSQISLIILPFLPFSIKYGVAGLLAVDIMGVIRGWRMFDHIAHLGGAMFGFFYYQYGVKGWVEGKKWMARILGLGRYKMEA